MKKIIAAALLLMILLSVTACGGIKSDDAKQSLTDLTACLAEARYEDAAKLMHADVTDVTAQAFEDYVASMKENHGIDFSAGVEIEKYTGFSSSAYNSEYDGSGYELRGNAEIGEKSVTFEILVVDNDNGDGIYGFSFYPEK